MASHSSIGRSPYLLLVALAACAQTPYVANPLVGSGHGDSGPAVAAILDGPSGLAEDANGNVYISESNAGVIRRVRPDGTIQRFAGSGMIGDDPAGSPALQTSLTYPSFLLMDTDGGLIFADLGTCRIRKVQLDGTVQDLAGTGSCTASRFSRSGTQILPGPETQISGIGGMVLDGAGRLVFTEQNNNLVRRVDSDGYVRTIAGTGYASFGGDSGDASAAAFRYPAGLAYDTSGNLYIGDGSNCRIRRIDTSNVITTIAGTSTCASTATSFSSGVITNRTLGYIGALAYDPGSNSLLFAMPGLYRVASIDLGQSRMGPFLGNGRLGAATSQDPLSITLNEPASILVSAGLGVLVAADTSFQVYQVQNGAVQTFAGQWPQLDTYPAAAAAQLVQATGLAVATDGSLLIADTGAGRLLRLQSPNQLSALAGNRYPTGFSLGDTGLAIAATLDQPYRAAQGPDGNIYFVQDSKVRSIDAQGVIRTLLDRLNNPAALVFDPAGRLVYSEAGLNQVIRYDLATKAKTVIAGTGAAGFSGDGGAATNGLLYGPGDLAFDSRGNLLVVDRGNRRVRRISPSGTIQTVIGSGGGFSYGDISGELATDVGFGPITGLAIDSSDNIYLSETLRIDTVSPDGHVRVLTGYLSQDDAGNWSYLNGPINDADGLAVDQYGTVYYSLRYEGCVMTLAPTQ